MRPKEDSWSGAVVGVDLGGSTVRAGRVRDGQVEACAERRISAGSADEVIREILAVVDAVFDDTVQGLGVGVPSVVDVRTGVVYDVMNIPSWREVPLKTLLEERYRRPTYVDNDANAFVAGELYFGKAQGACDVVGVTLGTGFGVGVVLDGALRRGRNCGVGELGTIPYRGGVLEDFCSGKFFTREAGVTAQTVAARAREGDTAACEVMRRFGAELGVGLQVVLYAYDPELIVLGGSISHALPLFEAPMREALTTFAYPHSLESLAIEVSSLTDAAILGATALFLDSSLASCRSELAGLRADR